MAAGSMGFCKMSGSELWARDQKILKIRAISNLDMPVLQLGGEGNLSSHCAAEKGNDIFLIPFWFFLIDAIQLSQDVDCRRRFTP
jgi:hypothetical protein